MTRLDLDGPSAGAAVEAVLTKKGGCGLARRRKRWPRSRRPNSRLASPLLSEGPRTAADAERRRQEEKASGTACAKKLPMDGWVGQEQEEEQVSKGESESESKGESRRRAPGVRPKSESLLREGCSG